VLVFLTVWAVRMSMLFTYQSSDMFTALQYVAEGLSSGNGQVRTAAEHAFWNSMIVFSVLAAIHVARSMIEYFLAQAFDIRWRVWLTERVTAQWLADRAEYRSRFIDNTIDNPDQRVQEDVTTFVQQSRALGIGAVNAVVSVVVFTGILWDLSGPMMFAGVQVPRAMVFLVMVFVLLGTVIAFWIGHPLIRLNFRYQRATATFRYALVRVRDNAEPIAFYRGERVEHRGLVERFGAVISSYWRVVYRETGFQGWNLSVSQVSVVFPWLIQAPRFFQGAITLGDMQQAAGAFGNLHDSLSFFRQSYDTFTEYRAALVRLDGLLQASTQSHELPKITESDLDGALELEGIAVRRPDGGALIDNLSLRLQPGDTLVVKGPSGSGKTTLLRTLAEMWPYGDGVIKRPGANGTLFLSQVPYLPLGDLRTAVSYPAAPGAIPDETLRAVLRKVHLGHLVDRLDEEADWAKILSPGEQQRLAFARILLLEPQLVFLDEATSAVDEGLEHALYTLIRTEVPDTMLVSVAHRSTVDQFHTQRLELGGEGTWELDRTVPALSPA
jgi:putative ATP-binding cassette transporter